MSCTNLSIRTHIIGGGLHHAGVCVCVLPVCVSDFSSLHNESLALVRQPSEAERSKAEADDHHHEFVSVCLCVCLYVRVCVCVSKVARPFALQLQCFVSVHSCICVCVSTRVAICPPHLAPFDGLARCIVGGE